MRRIPYILYIVAVATMVVSCNIHLAKPRLLMQEEYLFGKDFSHDSIVLGGDWWRMFGDTTLNRLVERAIAQNKNIEIAASRIEEARHSLIVTRSQYLPSISGAISVEEKYDSAKFFHKRVGSYLFLVRYATPQRGLRRPLTIRSGNIKVFALRSKPRLQPPTSRYCNIDKTLPFPAVAASCVERWLRL